MAKRREGEKHGSLHHQPHHPRLTDRPCINTRLETRWQITVIIPCGTCVLYRFLGSSLHPRPRTRTRHPMHNNIILRRPVNEKQYPDVYVIIGTNCFHVLTSVSSYTLPQHIHEIKLSFITFFFCSIPLSSFLRNRHRR